MSRRSRTSAKVGFQQELDFKKFTVVLSPDKLKYLLKYPRQISFPNNPCRKIKALNFLMKQKLRNKRRNLSTKISFSGFIALVKMRKGILCRVVKLFSGIRTRAQSDNHKTYAYIFPSAGKNVRGKNNIGSLSLLSK